MFTDPKNVAGYVNVDIDVKELKKDKQPPPKPRYKQIQAYVLDSGCVKLCQDSCGWGSEPPSKYIFCLFSCALIS